MGSQRSASVTSSRSRRRSAAVVSTASTAPAAVGDTDRPWRPWSGTRPSHGRNRSSFTVRWASRQAMVVTGGGSGGGQSKSHVHGAVGSAGPGRIVQHPATGCHRYSSSVSPSRRSARRPQAWSASATSSSRSAARATGPVWPIASDPSEGGPVATRKITIEEAVTTDEFEHFDEAFLPSIKSQYADYLSSRLHAKYVDRRIEDMDEDGIDVQVISLTAPGVQSVA